MNPLHLTDGYKLGHKQMYPEGTSNFTPRGTRRPKSAGITWFGLQYFVKEYLIKNWNENFFQQPKEVVVKQYFRRLKNYLGSDPDVSFIGELHDLGHLPVEIWSLPEGSLVPYKVAPFVIFSTHEKFSWLVNYCETLLSTTLWLPSTSATTARIFRQNLNYWAEKTGAPMEAVDFQCWDFSMRGMQGLEAALLSGAAHLIFSKGSDTVPAIDFLEKYYNADCEKELISPGVPASEHAVASLQILKDVMEGKSLEEGDITYISNLIDIFPNGILSVVSDTFDYWGTITKTLPALKEKIMARQGTLVSRPDSGVPFRILCGYKGFNFDEQGYDLDNDVNIMQSRGFEVVKDKGIWYEIVPGPRQDSDYELKETKLTDAEVKGSVQCLWESFGGTVNEKGFKQLDPHIGLIYGDGINIEVSDKICEGLYNNGFVSTSSVFGAGSWNYCGSVTRDTDGWAMKATVAIVNGETIEIYKDPITDNGLKKSARGFIAVYKDGDGNYYQKDQVSFEDVKNCEYQQIFANGKLMIDQSLAEIRERALKSL
jgi:nicotinamide phosphoribosyltransferase